MKPNTTFLKKHPRFWALTKFASEQLGYSRRITKDNPEGGLRKFDTREIKELTGQFRTDDLLLEEVEAYLNYRAEVIETHIQHLLMNGTEAKSIFTSLRKRHKPKCKLPMNKQKGKKKHYAYFTCIVNILTEVNLEGRNFDDNPAQLAVFIDKHQNLVQTLSHRIDGAYPSIVNPIAVWEIKEYYGTTTFGSRVSDGVYETQLDGFELSRAQVFSSRKIEHYLFVDDKFTWWTKGKSYLCRLLDAMHQQLVNEVIFGREVLEVWPGIVKSWKQ